MIVAQRRKENENTSIGKRRKMPMSRKARGFTLVEIIVVIIIAGIIFPAIILPFYYATRGINITVRREIMEMAVQGEIEARLMSAGYAAADGWSSQTVVDSNCVSQAYYYFVDPADFDASVGSDTGYKRFTVTVTPTQGGSPLEVVLVLTKKSS
jgi:prepilin-type N-terminal cleavage/methylation domain-containing protein